MYLQTDLLVLYTVAMHGFAYLVCRPRVELCVFCFLRGKQWFIAMWMFVLIALKDLVIAW